ncbi:MAG: BCD family MFS transporter [Proteobacteria bacterium]|nr:BCD family MFS transporter [Burkholderiales bacterium]
MPETDAGELHGPVNPERAPSAPGARVGTAGLGWLGIARLGLVQTSLGAIVVLTTSTMNRVMVVELALPAMLPGALVALHYAVQLLRPRLGHGSDVGGRRTPWIIGGMAVLALGGVGASVATAWMTTDVASGVALAVLSFILIGVGVGASGTALLTLLAKQVVPERRGAAATIVWIMMIVGFIVTAGTVGHFLDPFSPERLVALTAIVAALAFVTTVLAVRGIEADRHLYAATPGSDARARMQPRAFRAALAEVWTDTKARRFTVFVFMSMLAYSAQDLILEPFAGTVFGYTPGESTKLASVQNGGVLLGMVLVALATGRGTLGRRFGSLEAWTIGGCLASAAALSALVIGGHVGAGWPLRTTVFCLGVGNGAFAVAAIGSMMALAGDGPPAREGIRMGLWGAAQAIAFGAGGFVGAVLSDIARQVSGSAVSGYTTVFGLEAALFIVAAVLAGRIGVPHPRRPPHAMTALPNPVSPKRYAAELEGR